MTALCFLEVANCDLKLLVRRSQIATTFALSSLKAQFVTLNMKCQIGTSFPLRDQLLVQFVKYHAQLVREQLMNLAEAALL